MGDEALAGGRMKQIEDEHDDDDEQEAPYLTGIWMGVEGGETLRQNALCERG